MKAFDNPSINAHISVDIVWRYDYDTLPIEKVFQLKIPMLIYKVKSSDVSGSTSNENRSDRRGEEKRYTGSRETAQHG